MKADRYDITGTNWVGDTGIRFKCQVKGNGQ
jgi:hypothetical protein